MSTNESDGNERIDPRTERALTECMSVLPEGGDVFTVAGENGGTYRVDGREGRCTCPDHKHRDVRCEHLRRVTFAAGERAVPVGVDGVDELLGEHTDGRPQVVASDGGVIDAGDDGVILDEGDDGRPEGCDCGEWNAGSGLPCWPCYRDGFDEPARAGGE